MFDPRFDVQCFMFFWLCSHLDGEEIAGCFTLIIFLMSCNCWCSVAFPGGALG